MELRVRERAAPRDGPPPVARASEVLWSSETSGGAATSPRRSVSRKSIGGAVELRDRSMVAMQCRKSMSQEHRRCCGAPRTPSVRSLAARSASQEHRRCCGAPRTTWGDDAMSRRCRKSIGGAVELRVVLHRQPCDRHAMSQEHRRCCGAPSSRGGTAGQRPHSCRKSIGGAVELRAGGRRWRGGGRVVARASEVLWSSESHSRIKSSQGSTSSQEHRRCCGAPRLPRAHPLRDRGGVARASEMLWSSEDHARGALRFVGRVSQEHRRCCGAPRPGCAPA